MYFYRFKIDVKNLQLILMVFRGFHLMYCEKSRMAYIKCSVEATPFFHRKTCNPRLKNPNKNTSLRRRGYNNIMIFISSSGSIEKIRLFASLFVKSS